MQQLHAAAEAAAAHAGTPPPPSRTPASITTEELVREWVLQVRQDGWHVGGRFEGFEPRAPPQVTASRECRLAELADVISPDQLGPPSYFISHAWKNPFSHLVDTVSSFLREGEAEGEVDGEGVGSGETTFVWVDFVAINQHRARWVRCLGL